MNKLNIKVLLLMAVISVPIFVGCNNKKSTQPSQSQKIAQAKPSTPAYKSTFDEQSAYNFVETQPDFGPRVPGTPAHEKCAEYLYHQLKQYCDTAIVQNFKSRVFTGEIFDSKNIIGIFNPNAMKRVLLCAHWDSRPFADQDPDKANYNKHIDGANDGASGVGVLLEIARQLSMYKPNVGVDIIFFDVEDYGPDENTKLTIQGNTDIYWCLGSQYWARNPHTYDYRAFYAILLDMVGNTQPQFLREQFSYYYAKRIVDKVWNEARNLNYEDYFVDQVGGIVTDDHLPLNQIANIPAINIIHQDVSSSNGLFFDYWHTVNDNIQCIDSKSLKIVGDVVLTTVMKE